MSVGNWKDKKFQSVSGEGDARNQAELERYWIARFEDPNGSECEAEGLIHRAFTGRLRGSAKIARFLLDIASWEPGPPTRGAHLSGNERNRRMVVLRKKAFEVFMLDFLKVEFDPRKSIPTALRESPEIVAEITAALRLRLPEYNSHEIDKMAKYRQIAGSFVDVCLWCGFRMGESELVSDDEMVRVINNKLPDLIKLVDDCLLNVNLFAHFYGCTETERIKDRRRLMLAAVETHLSGGRPNYVVTDSLGSYVGEQLIGYYLREKGRLRGKIHNLEASYKNLWRRFPGMTEPEQLEAAQTDEDLKQLPKLRAELAALPTF